jgi:hypothetical protein
MTNEEIEKVKADGLRKALLEAVGEALWEVKRHLEDAAKDSFGNFEKNVELAKRQLANAIQLWEETPDSSKQMDKSVKARLAANPSTVAEPPVYNWMVDVAFTVEGPYQSFQEIPHGVLIAGMEARLKYLKKHRNECAGAFGECDSYEVPIPKA